jgi:1-acyl-sn-glycerol-3-phosphate acyltransferase
MTAASSLPLAVWLAFWRWRQRYHRYTVEGLQHLPAGRSALIVGYHARPLAYDLCMLTVEMYERRGQLPRMLVHRGVEVIPPLAWLQRGLGFITGDDVTDAVRRGELIMTTPGGVAEACRSACDRYRVAWGHHTGYLRLALHHHLPIVPVAAAGADDTYIGLTDAVPLADWLGLPRDWAWLAWLGVGPLGLWPISPPFPVRIRQLIGEPIHLQAEGAVNPDDTEALARLHDRVVKTVQALLDRVHTIPSPAPGYAPETPDPDEAGGGSHARNAGSA